MYSRIIIALTRKVPSPINSCRSLSSIAKSVSFGQKQEDKGSRHDWNRAVSEAERVVGYPTSFLSLRWLLSDEIANVALHLRKIVGSNHPLLKTGRNLLYNGKNTTQTWSLIVLLISKAAGHAPSIPDMEQDKSAGVLHSQRALAEVTEMIRISQMVHQSVVNLQPATMAKEDADSYEDMTFGNKIGLLTGDFLLSHSSVEVANLRNQELVELISSAIRDYSESQFLGDRDEQNNPLPSNPLKKTECKAIAVAKDLVESDFLISMNKENSMDMPEKEWELRHILTAGSLLAKSCQGTLKLAGQSEDFQKQGYLFGKHLSLAWQARMDAEPFQHSSLPVEGSFSLVSLPILFHLDHDPTLYEEIEKGKKSIDNVDYEKIHAEVLNGPGLEKTRKVLKKHTSAALEVLEQFPPSDARTALQNIILAIQDL